VNRLQLVARAKLEAGVLGTPPTTTVGLTGYDGKLVNWVDTAWQRIQSERNWDWLWEQTTVTVTANTNSTSGSIPAKRYEKERTKDANGAPLSYMPWALFTLAFPVIQSGTPSVWTIAPDKSFKVNAKPTSNSTYTVERYKNPTVMSDDSASPTGLPEEHHMLIVWRALMLYGGSEDDQTLVRHATVEHLKAMKGMAITDEPAPDWGVSW
jgi:hypothetical protein